MSPKRKKDRQNAQTVLVRTINDVSWDYFAVYKRNQGFFSKNSLECLQKTAPFAQGYLLFDSLGFSNP
jgi:hypothetical protein